MSIDAEMKIFGLLADDIGAVPAVKLCAFFGALGRSLYIPHTPIRGHLVEKVIGPEAWGRLVESYGDTSLSVPKLELGPLRRAGMVVALSRHGVPLNLMAAAASCTQIRIAQIRKELVLQGIDSSVLDTP